MIKDKSPSMVFLMQTKCSKKIIEEVSKILKFDSCLAVESRGSSGGLTLMWNYKTDMTIFNYPRWHIPDGSLPVFMAIWRQQKET